jgi:hypothetical protein
MTGLSTKSRISEAQMILHWIVALSMLLMINADDRQVRCPNDPSLMGYISIRDLNLDMKYQVSLLVPPLNQPPRDRYAFTICPVTTLDGSDQLTPLLASSHFVCGAEGKSQDDCVISGGTTQVLLMDVIEQAAASVSDRVNSFTFSGITFVESQDISIAALGSSRTRAEFYDCHWKVRTVPSYCSTVLSIFSFSHVVVLSNAYNFRVIMER